MYYMKKIFVFLAVCAMALCAASCVKQTPCLTLSPKSVTLKVGESVQLYPGIEGEAEGLSFSEVLRINPDDFACFLDNAYIVTAYEVGTSRVGIGILNDKDDPSKGLKFSAYTTVTVVE